MQSTRQQNNQTTKQPDNTNVFVFIDILSLISCLRNFSNNNTPNEKTNNIYMPDPLYSC